jgi:hypothetical protein
MDSIFQDRKYDIQDIIKDVFYSKISLLIKKNQILTKKEIKKNQLKKNKK